jgi:hypothetical protein
MFIVAFGVGAAAIALWTDYRLASLRPSNLRLAMLHVLIAMVIARFFVPVALHSVGDVATAVGAIFIVGLPASVYCLLATFWIMMQVADMLKSATGGPGSGAEA